MRKAVVLLSIMLLLVSVPPGVQATSNRPEFKLGDEVLFERFGHLLADKRIGLVTNPTGLDSKGEHIIDRLWRNANLVALYGPEHGIDGKAAAGVYVETYQHTVYDIPVYSLYGATRRPTAAMLSGVELLIFDIQDIGARSYTYISTMYYVMEAAKAHHIPILVLDRPNPVGGLIYEGPILEDFTIGFVGIDNLPIAHGMTVGELARFFNRKINAQLQVIPMEGYTRDMVWQDTGLPWVPTSPMIPYVESAFGYNATGLGDGTGIGQQDYFRWIGGAGIDSEKFAAMLTSSSLPGVTFVPETRGTRGGVRLVITDFHTFNPTRVNLHALAYGQQLTKFAIPKSGDTYNSLSMFAKVMGGNRMGRWLAEGKTPQAIEELYAAELAEFESKREAYLIYGSYNRPGPRIEVDSTLIYSDTAPFIDINNRTMVPYRAIAQALGANVHWNEKDRSVTMNIGTNSVVLTIANPIAMQNGQPLTMDTAPVITSGRTMVPIRYVGELLGAFVHWDDGEKTVKVKTETTK